jgi:hypothetical protein
VRILYVVWNYPSLSEPQVRWEAAYMAQHGAEIAVWAEEVAVSTYPAEYKAYYGGSLGGVIAEWRPDLICVHWLNRFKVHAAAIEASGVPAVAVGHSYDYSPGNVETALRIDAFRRVFLFRHFAARHPHPKVRAMDTAYDETLYRPLAEQDPSMVFRAGAGLPTKDLESFIRIAALCRREGFRFVLAVSRNDRTPYLDGLLAFNRALGNPCDVMVAATHEQCAELTARAAVYLRGFDPKCHEYGMPCSVAAAMRTGAVIVHRDHPWAREWIGDAGLYYKTDEEAAAAIRSTAAWSDEKWKLARTTSWMRAEPYAGQRALRPLWDGFREAAERRP